MNGHAVVPDCVQEKTFEQEAGGWRLPLTGSPDEHGGTTG